MFDRDLLYNLMKDLKYHNQALSVVVMKTVFNSRGKTRSIIEIASLFSSLKSGNKNMNGRTSDNYHGRLAERNERDDHGEREREKVLTMSNEKFDRNDA